LRPPSSRADVVVAVDLEVPVGVGGEPVVVAAVEDDRVLGGDVLVRQQGLEAGPVDEVPAQRVLQIGAPVQGDGPGDVAGVVGVAVLVDLDHDDVRLGQVLLQPVAVDQHVRSGHDHSSAEVWGVGGPTVRTAAAGVPRRRGGAVRGRRRSG
jgi:hypothetical protein